MYPQTFGPLYSLSDEEIDSINLIPMPKRSHHIISAYVNFTWCSVIAFRGNGSVMVIPFPMFNDKLVEPNFNKLSIINNGLTIKLGEYEMLVEHLLYDLDLDYRVWSNNNQLN